MRPHQDGRGDGYGKYAGMSVSETQELFEKCAADPSMRSISAVLRITREQLEARGGLGNYPVLASIAALFCLIVAAVWLFAPAGFHDLATKFLMGSCTVLAMLLLTVASTMKARRRNVAQEAAIRDAAVSAIAEMLKANPALKPLTIEQDFTVKLLLRKSPGSEPLRVLLELSA